MQHHRTSMTDPLAYFAYGSNMCTQRLQHRVPSARPYSTGFVAARVLRFHKGSKDQSGKCDASRTDVPTDRVWGVVFTIDAAQKVALDDAEGLGNGYQQEEVNVQTGHGPVTAFAYIAVPDAIQTTLQPYDWYKDFVLAGAIEHRLPDDYVADLQRVPACADPDAGRAASKRALLPSWYRGA